MSDARATVSAEPFLLAGLPLANWAFAFRIWVAMLVALYAAFWLQLDSASSSAVTVAILAQPRRGQALDKAFFRICATLFGFVVAIVITALFNQTRDMFLVAFAAWMAFAVYIATMYDGTRAYGAVLSGYTVAIIAVPQIDSPQNVWNAGISRVAVVSLGIASIALINDVFAAPEIYPNLRQRLVAAHQATRNLVTAYIRGETPGVQRAVDVLAAIIGCRLDTLALPSESPSGTPRREAGKSALAAMVGSISAARAYMYLLRDRPEAGTIVPRAAVEARDPGPIATALDAEMRKPDPSPDRIMLLDCALHLAERQRLAAHEVAAFEAAHWPERRLTLPIHRDREFSRRSAYRVFISICIVSILFVHSSWPMTSSVLSIVGILAGLGATTPDIRAFGKGAVIALPLAAVVAGVTEFLILDGADSFPLLAIGLAPAIFGACLLVQNPKTAGMGFLLLVFTPVLFPPANPQSYNPQSYVLTAFLFSLGTWVFAALLMTVLPTSHRDRRRWLVNAARRDLLRAIGGERRHTAPEATYLTADRIVAISQFQIGGPGGRINRLRYTLLLSNLTNAAVRGAEAFDELARKGICRPETAKARAAFATLRPGPLREAAAALARVPLPDDVDLRRTSACAIAALQISALLVEKYASTLRHLRQALSR